MLEAMRAASDKQIERTVRLVQDALAEELRSGQLQLERDDRHIVVRIQERGSFPSGSADIDPLFKRSLARIADALAIVPGQISVEGHTDDVPIKSARFRSNWELSSSRAAAVATALLGPGVIPASRMRVQGFAETKPRVPNDSNANRALNRRVEIIIDLRDASEELEQQVRELIEAGRQDLIPDIGWDDTTGAP
jgi:chemotaxis protein MotB